MILVIVKVLCRCGSERVMGIVDTVKGSGTALFFFVTAVIGIAVCPYSRRIKSMWELENQDNI